MRYIFLFILCLCQTVHAQMLVQSVAFNGSVIDKFGITVANTWANNVIVNGGSSPSQNTKTATANFVNALNNAGIWTKMYSIGTFAPDSFAAAMTPLKDPTKTIWPNYGGYLASSDLSTNGLRGTGNPASAKAITDTGVIPNSTLTAFNFGQSVYVTAAPAGHIIGNSSSADNANFFGISIRTFYSGASANSSVTAKVNVTDTGSRWFISGSRTANNLSIIYSGNATNALVADATNSTVVADVRSTITWGIPILAEEHNTGPVGFADRTVSFFAFHQGLTAAETQSLYNAVRALRTGFGGGL